MKHTITRSNKRINRRKNGKKTRRIKRLLKSFNRRKLTYNRKHKRSHRHKRSHSHKRSHKRGRNCNHSHKLRRRQKGGESPIGGYSSPGNSNDAHEKYEDAALRQNQLNKQSGGGVDCCNSSDPYSYPCPDGMCGPIPQTASETSNGLILQAAKITASTNANAEFDTKVADTNNSQNSCSK